MGLIGKLFGGKEGAPASTTPPLSAQFHESEPHSGPPSRTARRRELVQVVLRETMRGHGIPSDWIDCRVLSVVSGTPGAEGGKPSAGVHVTFIVRSGEDRLLTYVHAFQGSFLRKMREFEPRSMDWILSLSWQFSGDAPAGQPAMPDPAVWAQQASAGTTEAAGGPSAPTEDEELQQDLQALFAIRDAVLQQTVQPGRTDGAPTQGAASTAARNRPASS
jgi:hypothetical protein